MQEEKLPNDNTTPEEEKLDRREITRRMGKFLTYTAPALIALATAKDACAN
jgi:hypothetical protein